MTKITKSDSRILWYWENRDDRETFGPEPKYNERYLDLEEPSPVCKALECSDGCEPVDDKCMPYLELEEYCFSLGVKRCSENITICYRNRETESCDLGLECEALDCPDDESARCVPEGDRCIESHVQQVDFDSARDRKEAEDKENRINTDNVEGDSEADPADSSGGLGLGDDNNEVSKPEDSKPDDNPPPAPLEKEDTPKDDGDKPPQDTGDGENDLPQNDVEEIQSDMAKNGGPINPTFEKVQIQETFPEKSRRKYHYDGYPVNVLLLTNILVEDMDEKKTKFKGAYWGKRRRKRQFPPDERNTNRDNRKDKKKKKQQPTTVFGECLYFYEESAETTFDLNVAIDIFWKIYSTAIGYCNKYFGMRKSETFPNLYSMFVEDFIAHIEDEWRYPKDNEGLKAIRHEFVSERGQRWLDVCLESAYMVANATTYRPPRPLRLGNSNSKSKQQQNYFLQLPDYLNENYMWAGEEEFVAVSCPN